MGGALSGLMSGGGASAAGGSSGGGLMSMLGGMGGGSSGGGLFGGGGDTSKTSTDVHTQKVMGWDVPDLMRNMLEIGRDQKQYDSSAFVNAGKPSAVQPVQQASMDSTSKNLMNNLANKLVSDEESPSLDTQMGDLNTQIQGMGKQEFMKNPFKKNYGLSLLD